ncbi:hypothetical protein FRC17_002930 [Serendipita sp. 399]|nr:hypothetical protein FRC17_002930 [Serendipita sp. 399]
MLKLSEPTPQRFNRPAPSSAPVVAAPVPETVPLSPVDEQIPFPQSDQVPLKLRKMLHSLGLKAGKQGYIPWSALPHFLWKRGLYIAGIPSNLILGSLDPSMEAIEQKVKVSLVPHWNPSTISALVKAVEKDQVKILKRPQSREITFELVGKHRKIDLGRWKNLDNETAPAPEQDTSSMFYEPPREQLPNETRRRRTKHPTVIADSSSDEDEVPFRYAKEVPLKLRLLFRDAKVEEDPEEPGFIPWDAIPATLWNRGYYIAGLPKEFVLGRYTPEEIVKRAWKPQAIFSNKNMTTIRLKEVLNSGLVKLLKRPDGEYIDPPSDDDMFTRRLGRNVVFEVKDGDEVIDIGRWSESSTSDEESDEKMEEDNPPATTRQPEPLKTWMEQVNEVTDQLAELLVNAGVELPPHDKRPGAYKLVWDQLPLQLHRAKAYLTGIPLVLLPYWKQQERLNGRWAVKWNKETLDKMASLLDCDAIAVEKWTSDTNYVVHAIDPNGDRHFTYDDFVNALIDDPEAISRGGVVRSLLDTNIDPRRRPTRRPGPPTTDEESEDTDIQSEASHPMSRQHSELKRKASELPRHDRFLKRRKISVDDSQVSSQSQDEQAVEAALGRFTGRSHTVSHQSILASQEPWIPKNASQISNRELNRIFRRRKDLIKHLIAILIFHGIPCIALEFENGAYFLPWSNLPRHLAARSKYLAGFPSNCAPVVINDLVVDATGPYEWSDEQWNALDKALEADSIEVLPALNKRALFELVEEDGSRKPSLLGYSRQWMDANFGIEAGQSITIFAWDIKKRDPIIVETEVEDDDTMDTEL